MGKKGAHIYTFGSVSRLHSSSCGNAWFANEFARVDPSHGPKGDMTFSRTELDVKIVKFSIPAGVSDKSNRSVGTVKTYPEHLNAMSFCMTVDVLRKAQGKSDPRSFPIDSRERAVAEIEVLHDTLRMLRSDRSDLS